MLRRRRSPVARWTGLTPARRRTWRYRQGACGWTARVPPSWACAGRRSLRRIFPEGATPNHCRRLGGGDGGDGTKAGEQRRPHEPLDDLVCRLLLEKKKKASAIVTTHTDAAT